MINKKVMFVRVLDKTKKCVMVKVYDRSFNVIADKGTFRQKYESDEVSTLDMYAVMSVIISSGANQS